MAQNFDALVAEYPSWWIDFLGEHNHIGGAEATKWLLQRSNLVAGRTMLDAGAFVGAAARMVADRSAATAFASDVNADFLRTGAMMPGGGAVRWLAASTHRLPFPDRTFDSVWCLDAYIAPRELTRVAAAGSTLCLCCELPNDSRGGVEAFLDEWSELGWSLSAHKQMSLDALQTWRNAEAQMVAKRSHYEKRYGPRAYLGQLDLLAGLVQSYERGEMGHGLLVLTRP
ncbi:hypothetical protein AYO38_05865 [bacterium SCGC AG-212-C10]|nr:hypothetical protein AYO38_05865 [bacterium SCGC AG-212-C10]